MKEMLWQVGEVLAIWLVVSAFAVAVLSRIGVHLARVGQPGAERQQTSEDYEAELAGDIVEATGEVEEAALVQAEEPQEAIPRLWSAVHNSAAFEQAWAENELARERSENRKEAR